jgi:hypothetical protein
LSNEIPSPLPHPTDPAAPTAAIQAVANLTHVVPEHVRALLGPSWLIEGEDPKLYEELLGRVGAAVQPADIIDWLLLKDVVALTWEIQRSRRQRDTLVRMGRREAMEQVLDQAMPREGGIFDAGRGLVINDLTSQWLSGDTAATKRALGFLRKAGFSLNDIAAQSLTVKADELDRIDNQIQRHEARRDAILQQIERRREGLAQRVRRASEEAVDAEFVEAPSTAMALPANGGAKG